MSFQYLYAVLALKCLSCVTHECYVGQAKEAAEKKAREISASVESLSAELRNEKQVSSSALSSAKRASKESEAIKRAVQSLGCKIQFSRSGDCTVDIENSVVNAADKFTYSPSKRQPENILQSSERDLSVSITVEQDNAAAVNPVGRACEALCPLRSRDGGCRWPDAGCAQLSSQFVGLRANFDAFDRLSIYDGYFEPK